MIACLPRRKRGEAMGQSIGASSAGGWLSGSNLNADQAIPDGTVIPAPLPSAGEASAEIEELSAEVGEIMGFETEASAEVPFESLDKASMGQGGRITQRIVTDDNTVDYYRDKPVGILTVYLALPEQFKAIMEKGKRQDSKKKDKFVHSGEVGGVQVPLIGKADIL